MIREGSICNQEKVYEHYNPNVNKDNYISIAKSIGIILMVAGHAGCADFICRYIYMFHMPLFFFCSGYFLKQPMKLKQVRVFILHRMHGLYLPYVKWAILFLLFHNVFYEIGFYSHDGSQLYDMQEYARRLLHIVTSMNGHESLLDPFWFLKQLFLSSILVYSVLFLLRSWSVLRRLVFVFFTFLVLTIVFKYYKVGLPIIWDLSIVCLSSVFFLMGHIYKKVEKCCFYRWYTFVCPMVLLAFVVALYNDSLDMLWYDSKSVLLYVLSAPLGIFSIFCISFYMEKTVIRNVFYYIGNHTMPILVFHLLAFIIVSYIRIQMYDLPIELLARYKALDQHNGAIFFISYCLVGIALPLIVDACLQWCKDSVRSSKK